MKKGLFILGLFLTLQSLWAQDAVLRFTYFLTNMGDYLIVGQEPDDGATYTGTMSFSLDKNENLLIQRTVNGETQICSYEWGYPMEDYLSTMDVSFTMNGVQYTANYLLVYDSWASSVSIIGSYYPTDGNAELSGHEALFLDFGY